jgi:general secretion pathway protein G
VVSFIKGIRDMRSRYMEKGFTLIELIIVFTLIGILVGLGIPQYKYAVKKANEAALKETLFQMRTLLQQYYTDKHKYPISLQTLVDEKYLLKIPLDPMTKSTETWIEIQETLLEDDLLEGVIPGTADVRSGSYKKAIDGTIYNTW